MKLDTTFIRYQLAIQDLTQKELAERANVTRTTISNMLGKGTAHPKTVIKVAKALGFPIAEMYQNPRED